MKAIALHFFFILLISGSFNPMGHAQRKMEYLDRGLVAMRKDQGSVFLNWRLLATDDPSIAFNIYRQTGKKQIKKDK